ncbi:acetate--CoA ligase family protein [Aeromicrobium duanguangcaii]|uniref:Acetate--CoA ligase family protein n=1 Tax=Aeromicrobium duanguangcaii TaxID=2968086 RepID=A0ABY5KD94_9ACTN|nr:acetate--CoA ligase family protein [Aeromicrobium duanguangcaii]MCD9154512.1 acetate--CoA ligase family protein [Aeromicrobium duanguangcaii]MCL3838260.1 acetate--CoA ligase family protein [Aeromicrobium duanguangcaii]UUI68432.1 acetate--CoA ligase family protein [Aeromicrobium duanguangcaii]
MTGTSTIDPMAFFRPKSVALVGATDKSGWSVATFNNLRVNGFAGDVYLVNPKATEVHDTPAFASLADIPAAVDLVYVMTPIGVVPEVIRLGAELGTRHYVVLTAGYGEVGGEGAVRERELLDLAEELDVTILGPNGNGFINAADGITPYGLPIPQPLIAGSVGVVLQSGALASSVLSFAQSRNIGISLLVAMGNETVMSVTDVVRGLVADPKTKAIALFLESVRKPEEFAEVARAALEAGKPIVALKIGRSVKASRTAQAHTGALVGDDKTVAAAFEQLGVIRVVSLEDLIITAGMLAATGPLPGKRVGVVTPSGGASEIIADRAEDEGLDLPEFTDETTARLREVLPSFATPNNPLDVTGYVLLDRELMGRALQVVAADPGIDFVMMLQDLPRQTPDPQLALELYSRNAATIREASTPIIPVGNVLTDINETGRMIQAGSDYPQVAGGIEHGLTALGHAVRWSETLRNHRAGRQQPPQVTAAFPDGLPERRGSWSEASAAKFLAANGVPMVPAELVSSADDAVAAAERIGYPVVVKAAVEGLEHKSDIGGVKLDLASAEQVREAVEQVLGATARAGHEGAQVLVQPQRSGGTELLVGVVRDPAWGLTLAVALGGVWVELLGESALRVLPVAQDEVRRAIGSLRGLRVLQGARGGEAVDIDELARVVTQIGALAHALGDELVALEVNPLLVSAERIEALDALVTWAAE